MVSATTPTTPPAQTTDAVDVKALQNRIVALEGEVSDLRRHVERIETQAAIRKGQEAAAKGLVIPARELVAALRAKYNLPTP